MSFAQKHILIIEDNEDHGYYLEFILNNKPYLVDRLTNGQDALQQCKKKQYDLVIIDINLPDISGEEVAKQLKAEPNYKQTPLIAYTANAVPGQLSEDLFVDLLEKPVLPELVRRKVENWI